MSDLFHDVDEMMRQERLMTLWRRHGNAVIGGVLILILAVAAQQVYQSWFKTYAEKQTQALITAEGKTEDLVALIAQKKSGNTAALARLMAAQKMLESDKKDEAIALYQALRNDHAAAQDFRDLATLLWVRAVSADDKEKPAALRAALAPLMRDEGQPYAWAARLESALIAAQRQQDFKTALDLLTPMVSHPALPRTQSDRAAALVDLYRVQQAAAVPQKTEAPKTTEPTK